MPTKKRHQSFEQALRQGNRKQVLACLENGDAYFFDDDENRIEPFLVALKQQHWAMALDLLEYPSYRDYILPRVPEDMEFEKLKREREERIEQGEDVPEVENPNPLAKASQSKYCVGLLLDALDTYRPTKPLMSKLVERLDALATKAWADTPASTATLALAYDSPEWFEPTLSKDVSPNAWAIHGTIGSTLTRLELAAMRGQKERLNRLLDQGAHANWLSHCDRNAAHAAAEIERYALRRNDYICPQAMLDRKACLDRLAMEPGVMEQRDLHGKTPRDLLAASLEWFAASAVPSIKYGVSAEDVARYKALRMEVLMNDSNLAPSTKRPRI